MGDESQLLTPGEVAALLRVNAKTVTRWALKGVLPSFQTPGGHHRFRRSDVEQIINGSVTAEDQP